MQDFTVYLDKINQIQVGQIEQMERKNLQRSGHYQQGVQVQKLQLPLGRINEKKEAESRNIVMGHNRKLQKVILDKLTDVENQNKKLLSLAGKINNATLIFSDDDKLHQLIYTIQQQMKSAFNDLIESIQEFYIDIDTKIKQIGSYLATLSGMDTLQTSSQYQDDFIFSSNPVQINKNYHQKSSQQLHDQETLRQINHKIQILQKDLDQTKSNQKKLMTIIDKLVSKYQLTHQTTIVKEDPFLNKKMQNLMGKLELTQNHNIYHFDNKNQQFSGQNSGRFVQANTFSKNNFYPQHQNNGVTIKGNISSSNAVKKQQIPQRNVHSAQNPNDYSICHELNKLEDLKSQKQSYVHKHNSNFNNVDKPMLKKKLVENMAQKFGSSTISVQSYAYSNSMSQNQQQQCFIKKLYSKQTPTLNKVSLKSCNQNNTFFQYNKPKEQPIDQSNKNHRQAFLLAQLKR